MIDNNVINEVKNRLIKAYDPLAIYLFGSYAWGTPTKDSDLDLLIIVEKSEEKTYKRPIAGQRALNEFDRYSTLSWAPDFFVSPCSQRG